ncbi:cupin domain-containing protein [Desulfonatronovibrio magnus]|uniref:cupin domain-containing protein n=1 Tax=Desulfonatronovibrio magnus TaxID=698827 RepID=UPI0005EB4C77|nr:cupin domain-containing protein [Desulfonatronovibrio magnus]
MKAIHCGITSREYKDHPKFAGVKIAILIKSTDSEAVSVSELQVDPGVKAPIHTHDLQIDSIYVVSGTARAYINQEWIEVSAGDYIYVPATAEHGLHNTGDEILRLFVHHSPPLF